MDGRVQADARDQPRRVRRYRQLIDTLVPGVVPGNIGQWGAPVSGCADTSAGIVTGARIATSAGPHHAKRRRI
jgi:hypothetical protein